MDVVINRILVNDQLVSDQPGLIAFCEAVHRICEQEKGSGKKLEVMVKRGSEVLESETATL